MRDLYFLAPQVIIPCFVLCHKPHKIIRLIFEEYCCYIKDFLQYPSFLCVCPPLPPLPRLPNTIYSSGPSGSCSFYYSQLLELFSSEVSSRRSNFSILNCFVCFLLWGPLISSRDHHYTCWYLGGGVKSVSRPELETLRGLSPKPSTWCHTIYWGATKFTLRWFGFKETDLGKYFQCGFKGVGHCFKSDL